MDKTNHYHNRSIYEYKYKKYKAKYLNLKYQKGGNYGTISVVIPCIPKHIKYLDESIGYLVEQTLKPTNIIIALSETSKEDGEKLEKELNNKFNIPIKILSSPEKHGAASNRNRGGLYSKSDIISFIDADDKTIKTKLEKVISNMKKYNADFGLHGMTDSAPNECIVMTPEQFSKYEAEHRDGLWLGHWGLNIHSGHITIKRSVLDKVKCDVNFGYGEDSAYVRDLFKNGYRGVFVCDGLVKYNIDRSSWKKS